MSTNEDYLQKHADEIAKRASLHYDCYYLSDMFIDDLEDWAGEEDTRSAINSLNYFIDEMEYAISELRGLISTAKRTIRRRIVEEVYETSTERGKAEREERIHRDEAREKAIEQSLNALDAMSDEDFYEAIEESFSELNDKLAGLTPPKEQESLYPPDLDINNPFNINRPLGKF